MVHMLRLLTACFALLTLASAVTAHDQRQRSPNVVVIISDDAGYGDFGAYGGKQIPTPNIDAIAQSGVLFTQGYVCASVCHPSRAGLLTGRYPHRFGQEYNGPNRPESGFSRDQMGLDVAEKTIADAFQELGYRTMEIGKWHMGKADQFNPLQRGFDECFLIESGNRSYFPYKQEVGTSKRIFRNRDMVPEQEIEYVTDSLSDAAVEFIDRQQQTPFFMYLSYTAVHTPMHGKEEDLQAFHEISNKTRRTYAAMFKAMDEGIGRVREAIERNGLTDDTLVVFINDNGGPPGNASNNGPLRGVKGTHFEGGNRVAYLMTLPGVLPAGVTYDQPVSSLDILPTTLAAAGAEPQGHKSLDGVNLLPYLTGEKTERPHPTLYWRRPPGAAIRHGDWKLLRVAGLPTMLFDLANDVGESVDMSHVHPEKTAELAEMLTAWEKDLAPPKWTEGERWANIQRRKHKEAMVDIRRATPTDAQ